MPQMPSEQAAAGDTIDVLVACGSHAQQSQWQRIWELSNAAYFDRQHRTLWWRILHGSLMCGAYIVFFFFFFFGLQGNCLFCVSKKLPQTPDEPDLC